MDKKVAKLAGWRISDEMTDRDRGADGDGAEGMHRLDSPECRIIIIIRIESVDGNNHNLKEGEDCIVS